MQIFIGDIGGGTYITIRSDVLLTSICQQSPVYSYTAQISVLIFIAPLTLVRPSSFCSTPKLITSIVAIGYAIVGILVALYLWLWMARANRKRDAMAGSTSEKHHVHGHGDRDPTYRFQL
jgi:drug/metabolite transporter (DMT)-like permease